MIKEKFKSIFKLFQVSVNEFLDDNCIKFSAALSYFTIFSIPSLAILIISSAGYFFGEDAVRGEFFNQIQNLVGEKAAFQIQEAIKNIKLSNNMSIATIIGFATLLFGNYFDTNDRNAGLVNFILGSTHITEGAIPFAAKDPI